MHSTKHVSQGYKNSRPLTHNCVYERPRREDEEAIFRIKEIPRNKVIRKHLRGVAKSTIPSCGNALTRIEVRNNNGSTVYKKKDEVESHAARKLTDWCKLVRDAPTHAQGGYSMMWNTWTTLQSLKQY